MAGSTIQHDGEGEHRMAEISRLGLFSPVNDTANSSNMDSMDTFTSISTQTSPMLDMEQFLKEEILNPIDSSYGSHDSDSTVIQYAQNVCRNTFEIDAQLNQNFTKDFHALSTKKRASTTINKFEALFNRYINAVRESEEATDLDIHTTFEEFKYDVITNYLSRTSTHFHSAIELDNSTNEYENQDDAKERLFIKLRDTPYAILLHSVMPKLIVFSIGSYIRNNIKLLGLRAKISLTILITSIVNMVNNAKNGVKFYANLMKYRTRKLLRRISDLERYFTKEKVRKRKVGTSKVNILSSSVHFLITVLVKRIHGFIMIGINPSSLWNYLVLYGLDHNLEELKVVRSITNNSGNCSCIWNDQFARLIRTLDYVKKILLCVIMSSVELRNNGFGDEEIKKCKAFTRKFLNKFGFEDPIMKEQNLQISTRILFITVNVSDLLDFLESFRKELGSGDYGYNTCETSELDTLSETNEDERVKELSDIIDRITTKIDLVELGINSKESNMEHLGKEIDDLVKCYREMASGKSKRMTFDNIELKKLRMSDILLDEFEEEQLKKHRRSSGLNVSLVSVVKEEEEEEACEDIVVDEQATATEEFKKTLEKLCMKKIPKETTGLDSSVLA